MTDVTVTIPRQADHSVTAAASELASRAQAGALKSWKNTMSSRLALMAFVVLGVVMPRHRVSPSASPMTGSGGHPVRCGFPVLARTALEYWIVRPSRTMTAERLVEIEIDKQNTSVRRDGTVVQQPTPARRPPAGRRRGGAGR